ncbi:SRPBCC family protein [Hoyosella sp. YIM 151337]|uniref:SRPBCC family protein n=1 Tax=Hoyosella sp. YIM 151337 TaxID=2992742 RepID=UPI0022365B67|nr:SRPBCC family protein [Hoyosella sp. YIM 151337]MCW4354865.1 SRPBCC family protein [Hoyosella sp. YIM 151337]
MFDLQECDASFFETAPTVRSFSLDLPVPAAQVWEGLSSDTPLAWCSLLSNGRYTSRRPFGAGTNREITVARMLDLCEEFFRWEEGRRHSFWVMQASLPMFRRFAEDYLVEPTATGCRFTWTFAFEPLPALARPNVAAGL